MLNMFRNWVNQRFSDPQIIILWVLLISGFLIIVYLGDMLTPVFAGLIIAYLLEGIVSTLQRIKIPRKISVLIAFLVFIFCALLLLIGLLPLISRQIGPLFTDLPSMITNVQKQLLLLPDRYPEFVSETQINNMIGFLKSELTRLGQAVLFFSVASVKNLITVLVYFVLVPFLVLFFLKDKAPCCGYGMGLSYTHPDVAAKMAERIVSIGSMSKAEVLVMGCPTCRDVVLENISKKGPKKPKIEIVDLPMFLDRIVK